MFILLSIAFLAALFVITHICSGKIKFPSTWQSRLLALALLIIIITFPLASIPLHVFGQPSGPERWLGVWTGTLQFACMILGMFAKVVWDALETIGDNDPVKLNFRSLFKPALVSPIVFIAVLQTVNNGLSILFLCFAFQNGFFWQTILGKVAEQHGVTMKAVDSTTSSGGK